MKPWPCTYHTGASPVGRFLHSLAFLVSSSCAVYWLTISNQRWEIFGERVRNEIGFSSPRYWYREAGTCSAVALIWGKVWMPEGMT